MQANQTNWKIEKKLESGILHKKCNETRFCVCVAFFFVRLASCFSHSLDRAHTEKNMREVCKESTMAQTHTNTHTHTYTRFKPRCEKRKPKALNEMRKTERGKKMNNLVVYKRLLFSNKSALHIFARELMAWLYASYWYGLCFFVCVSFASICSVPQIVCFGIDSC